MIIEEQFFYQFRENGREWSQSRAYATREEAERNMHGNVHLVNGREGRVVRVATDVLSSVKPPRI